MPDVSNPTTFAAKTSIPAHGYVVVSCGQSDDGGGILQSTCLTDGRPSMCFHATWNISSSSGDTVFLLGPSGQVLLSTVYPANAVPDGHTYGRIPDMPGDDTATQPTPAAPTQVP
ncbi:MAG TPA: hypothetical protein VHB21_07095 [Minicystis sp.]|nr:hypothetical protein [Minicystis sp.]